MRKISEILSESVWGGILDRGAGNKIRKEDDINNLDGEGLYDYIKSHYKLFNTIDMAYLPESSRIDVPIFMRGGSRGLSFNYEKKVVFTNYFMPYSISGLFPKLTHRFTVKADSDENPSLYMIYPKDDVRIEVTNKFFIEVIDFLLENVPENDRCIEKIVEESVWGGILDRGAGETIRKENDVDNMDPETFKEYLKRLYKPLNSYAIIINSKGIISVPIIKKDVNCSICFNTNVEKNGISITDDIINYVNGLLNKLEHIYMVDEVDIQISKVYIISPKDESDVTNSFFIEVVNFLLKNIPDSYTKSLEIIDKNHK